MLDASEPKGLARPPARWALVLAFGVIYLIWGGNFLAIRIAVETIPPFLLMASRSMLAGAVLFVSALASGEPWPRLEDWARAAAVGALLFLVGHGGLAWGQQHVPSGVGALLMSTIPLWMVLLDWRVRRTRTPEPATWLALALGMTGIALLVGPGAAGRASAAPALPAAALLLGAFGWAAGSILSRTLSLPASLLVATGMQLLTGGLLLLVVAAGSGELAAPLAVSRRSGLAMAYMVIFASLIALTAYVWLLRVSTPTRVASYAFVNPLVAVLVGWSLGGEALTGRIGLAAAVIVTAVVLIVVPRAPAKPA